MLKANGGDLSYDSHSVDRGSPDDLWTNKMAEEFRAWREYPLIPNLPALFHDIFSFNEGSAPRLRNRLYAVRGDLDYKATRPLRAVPCGADRTSDDGAIRASMPGHRSQRCGISVY